MIEFNPESTQHLSLLLFGGSIIDEELIEDGIYKTGKRKGEKKYKLLKKDLKIEGLGLHPLDEWKQKKEGCYSTNEEVLQFIVKAEENASLIDLPISQDAIEICKSILKIRELQKQISTYYESTEKVVWECDSCVHPSFIHVWSDTGRLSSREINIQNQPKPPSYVTKHFTSRYINGKIVVADYKQIELVVQAELSQDYVYIQDVKNGIDFHCKRLALKEGKSYEEVVQLVNEFPVWKSKRGQIKGFSFQRAYGAYPTSISKKTGIPKQEVEALIKKEELEYPQLTTWQAGLQQEVKTYGCYKGITGRKYKFKSYPTLEFMQQRGIYAQYSSNQVLNYIIQGTATADLVLIMVGRFWRQKAIWNRDKYLMVNTVHDNLILDCKQEYTAVAKEGLKVLTEWREMCYNNFNYSWSVPVNIEISEGETWYECF